MSVARTRSAIVVREGLAGVDIIGGRRSNTRCTDSEMVCDQPLNLDLKFAITLAGAFDEGPPLAGNAAVFRKAPRSRRTERAAEGE